MKKNLLIPRQRTRMKSLINVMSLKISQDLYISLNIPH